VCSGVRQADIRELTSPHNRGSVLCSPPARRATTTAPLPPAYPRPTAPPRPGAPQCPPAPPARLESVLAPRYSAEHMFDVPARAGQNEQGADRWI
jgi:hypothetical protein